MVKYGLTKRAPDAGDFAAISSSFKRLIIFLVGRLRRPPPQRRYPQGKPQSVSPSTSESVIKWWFIL